MEDDWSDVLQDFKLDSLFDKLNISDSNTDLDTIERKSTSKSSLLDISSLASEFVPEVENLFKDMKLQNRKVLIKIIERIKTGKYKNIIVLSGAGVSTGAGIPDFRSPGTGLYDNLKEYNLPYPEAIFELDFFKENPRPFLRLAKELFPGAYKPTLSHKFIKCLDNRKLLLRNYTQNIDDLELFAEITDTKVIQAHGTFKRAHCIDCSKNYDIEKYKADVMSQLITKCECGGLVKPNIVFFGENLPLHFYKYSRIDFKQCDLLIIMGTSLTVYPVAGLVNFAPKVPRLLLNRELCGNFNFNSIDAAILGSLDEICSRLTEYLEN